MRTVAFLLLISLAFLGGQTGCTHLDEPPKSKVPIKELPLAEYHDTTILDMYEGSHLSWILKTMHLVKWPRTDLVRARPVDLNVYDSLGKILVRVTSDSGTVDEAVSFLVASGHVHGHSEKGVDIVTDSLRWNKAINQISTEAHVRVVSEDGDILTGRGFLSDAKLDNWQILSDVHGVFRKVQERFQKADQDTSHVKPDTSHAKPDISQPKPTTVNRQPERPAVKPPPNPDLPRLPPGFPTTAAEAAEHSGAPSAVPPKALPARSKP